MKDVLIVVDMQNDFVTGALGSAEAVAALPGVVERARQALADGERLIFTLDTHGADYLSTHEGKQLPVVHCVRGEPGWELAPGLKELSAAAELIEKPAFGSTELAHRLASEAVAAGLDSGRGLTIELCGVCTDICVVSNALMLRAALPEAELRVRAALCAGVTPERHAAALEVMRACQIDVI